MYLSVISFQVFKSLFTFADSWMTMLTGLFSNQTSMRQSWIFLPVVFQFSLMSSHRQTQVNSLHLYGWLSSSEGNLLVTNLSAVILADLYCFLSCGNIPSFLCVYCDSIKCCIYVKVFFWGVFIWFLIIFSLLLLYWIDFVIDSQFM